jgi:hypothetical protein
MDYCVLCSRYFASREALEQHERDSSKHNKTFHCQDRNKSFGSNKTLKNHRRSCQTASSWPLDPVDTPLYQGRDEGVSRNTWPRPTIDLQSLFLEHFARIQISAGPVSTPAHSQITERVIFKPTQETREIFMFPELHQNIVEAVFPEISSTWFNDNNSDDDFNDEWFTHVTGTFACNNRICKGRHWGSGMIHIEIRGYDDNGYSAAVYNQRCKSCNRLGTFELNVDSYIDRVAYRLKKWAGVAMVPPYYDPKATPPHERAFCEGCKRGRCQAGDGPAS